MPCIATPLLAASMAMTALLRAAEFTIPDRAEAPSRHGRVLPESTTRLFVSSQLLLQKTPCLQPTRQFR